MNGNGSTNKVPKGRVLGGNRSSVGKQGGAGVKVGSGDGGRGSRDESPSVPNESSSSSLSLSSLGNLESLQIQENVDLFCPICNDKMVTLTQLNRHLDDEHQSDLPVRQLDRDIKTWFKKKVISKANDVIGDKKNFVKLDLFDNDRNFTFSSANDAGVLVQETGESKPLDIQIPKDHWKKLSGNDICHLEGCTRHLGIKNGNVNCRKCGFLFCNEHTFFKIRIDEQLDYNLEHGVLVRCCKKCFVNKPGYKDTAYVRDLTVRFTERRLEKTVQTALEVNRLERRLLKFYEYFLQLDVAGSGLALGFGSNFKKFENSVVNWENDRLHNECFNCKNKFSYTSLLRKHHCRLCGRVVCGDFTTQCSLEVPLNVLMRYLMLGEGAKKYPLLAKNADKSIRVCISCKKILFDKRLFTSDVKAPKPESLKLYDTIIIYRSKITSMLPAFKGSLTTLQDLDNSKQRSHVKTMDKLINNHEKIQTISKDRIKLKEMFKKLDTITKKLHQKILQDEQEQLVSSDELRLEKSIYSVAVNFLQENMAKLQEISNDGNQLNSKTPQDGSPTPTTGITSPAKITKKEVRLNREKLMVLKEQKFLVEEMIDNCKKKRKFEDLQSLENNLKDIDKEIDTIESTLGEEYGFD